MRRAIVGIAVAVLALAACGDDDDTGNDLETTTSSSPPTSAVASTIAAGSTAPGGGEPSATPTPADDVESVASLDELNFLLPPIALEGTSETHVVELQNSTLVVDTDGSALCLGGDGDPPPTCRGPGHHGVLAFSDSQSDPPVYVVLTASSIGVEFAFTGGSALTCFSEAASRIGAVTVSWCEGTFPATIVFTTPEGRRLQFDVGG